MNFSLDCMEVSQLPGNLGEVSKLLCQLSLHITLTTKTPSVVEREVGKLPYFSLIW